MVQTFNRGLFFSRNFIPNRGHTQSFHGWPWTFCVCVSTIYPWTIPVPLRTCKSMVGTFFFFTRMPMQCNLLPIGGSLTIVDIHGWCMSTVSLWFFWCVSTAEGIYKRARAHTHTHTHTHKQQHTHTHANHMKCPSISSSFYPEYDWVRKGKKMHLENIHTFWVLLHQ